MQRLLQLAVVFVGLASHACLAFVASTSAHVAVAQARSSKLVLAEAKAGTDTAAPAVAAATPDIAAARLVIKEAVDTKKVDKEVVISALQALELAGPSAAQADVANHDWSLIFFSQGKGGYMPVKEIIVFDVDGGEISLRSSWGPLPLATIRGTCAWAAAHPCTVDFTLSKVKMGPIPIKKAPKSMSYSFFYADGEVAAATRSSGGYLLLKRA